jgi:CRP/FNR family transcriptional regulator, nitrogen oxide reductase regulator
MLTDLLYRLQFPKEEIYIPLGENLFTEGEKAHGVFLVQQGNLAILRKNSLQEDVLLKFIPPQKVVALHGLQTDHYHHTAKALNAVNGWCIDKSTVQDLINEYPTLRLSLMQAVCQDISYLEDKHLSSSLHYKVQIANILCEFYYTLGNQQQSYTLFPYPELCRRLGKSTQAIQKILDEFEQKDWLKQDGQKLIITNPQALISLGMTQT